MEHLENLKIRKRRAAESAASQSGGSPRGSTKVVSFAAWFAIGMATTMKHGGPCEAAYGAFKRFVDLDPNHAPGHDNLGNTLIARKDYPRAEEHFRAAIRLDPKHAGAQQGLAVVLRKRGDLDGAMRAALEYVRLSGDPEGSGKVIVAKLRAQKKASPPAAKPDSLNVVS